MEAFKFLDQAGATALTGYRWPLPSGQAPGAWVEAANVRPCYEGIHACTADDLAYWISDHLWVIELDGQIVPGRHKVAAARGRLVRPVERWRDRVLAELAADVAWRSRELATAILRQHDQPGLADRFAACRSLSELAELRPPVMDAMDKRSFVGVAALLAGDCAFLAERGKPAEAPFVAACAAGHAAAGLAGAEPAYRAAFDAERSRQSRWIAERLEPAGRRRHPRWWRR